MGLIVSWMLKLANYSTKSWWVEETGTSCLLLTRWPLWSALVKRMPGAVCECVGGLECVCVFASRCLCLRAHAAAGNQSWQQGLWAERSQRRGRQVPAADKENKATLNVSIEVSFGANASRLTRVIRTCLIMTVCLRIKNGKQQVTGRKITSLNNLFYL